MDKIGILAAIPQESRAVLRLVRTGKNCLKKWHHYHLFTISSHECWLTTSGMGLKRAAETAKAVIHDVNPDLLVSVGIAGSINDIPDIGDVVLAYSAHLPGLSPNKPSVSLAKISDLTWEEIENELLLTGTHLFKGTAVSTNGHQPDPINLFGLENPILEMETWGIAQVAKEHGIPLLSIRAISDNPNAPIPIDLETCVDEDYNFKYWKILETFIKHPAKIPQLVRMERNTRLAANNAAFGLFVVLRQESLIYLVDDSE